MPHGCSKFFVLAFGENVRVFSSWSYIGISWILSPGDNEANTFLIHEIIIVFLFSADYV